MYPAVTGFEWVWDDACHYLRIFLAGDRHEKATDYFRGTQLQLVSRARSVCWHFCRSTTNVRPARRGPPQGWKTSSGTRLGEPGVGYKEPGDRRSAGTGAGPRSRSCSEDGH